MPGNLAAEYGQGPDRSERLVTAWNRIRRFDAQWRLALSCLSYGATSLMVLFGLWKLQLAFGFFMTLFSIVAVGSFGIGLIWTLIVALPSRIARREYRAALKACAQEEGGMEPMIQYLLGRLEAEDYGNNGGYIGILGDLKESRAYPLILPALNDSYPPFRRAAVQALGSLGDPRAVQPLEGVSNDPDKVVKELASAALRKLSRARKPEERSGKEDDHG